MKVIKNGDIRIFPYYKGEYIGYTDLGYDSIGNAFKNMRPIPKSDVEIVVGNEIEVLLKCGKIKILDKNKLEKYYDYNKKEYVTYDGLFEGGGEEVYINRLGFDRDTAIELIEHTLKNERFYHFHRPECIEGKRKFEEKWGVYPFICRDYNAERELWYKTVKELVEFRKGKINISVEFLSE